MKLVLASEDEILNTTETSVNDKKGTCEKIPYSQNFIGNYMLAISCLFYLLLSLLYKILNKKRIQIILLI